MVGNGKGKAALVHLMKAYGGVEVKLYTFQTFTMYQGCPFHGLHAAHSHVCKLCVYYTNYNTIEEVTDRLL